MIPDEKVFQGYYSVRRFLKRCCRLNLFTEHTLNKTLDDWRERDRWIQKERNNYAMGLAVDPSDGRMYPASGNT